MKVKKMIATASMFAVLGLITACTDNSSNSSDSSSNSSATSENSSTETSESVDLESLELPQLSNEVADNEALVEMVTTEGSIKIKLFPEYAPKTVENFLTHAKEGYYDGITFHRVISNFMIQGGDPNGTGAGGESIWGEPFEDEFSKNLYNIRGALSMANSGEDTNGSQFFIVQNTDNMSDGLLYDDYPKAIIDAYKKGGAPYLDKKHTVFGQVTEGMDVVDKIADLETDSSDKPTKDIKIEKINILQEAK